jgi:2-hydroxychromene-2-carboxylate isomerase
MPIVGESQNPGVMRRLRGSAHTRRVCARLLALASLSMLSLGASCDRKSTGQSVANATASQSSGERIERLEGVDVSELTDAEVETWASLINEQLSPCGDPVSVAHCAAERRGCGACLTAARYLTRLVTEGYDKQTIEQHYSGRFGKTAREQIVTDAAPVRGAPMAPVTIIEFSDFQCPHCAAAHQELDRLMREFEGQIKLIYKHFPLGGHERAIPAARAAEAAARQGKFWEMHDVLFARQQALEDDDLDNYARQLGLDVERFKTDMSSPEVQARIDADRREGERLTIQGTPTMYVDGRLLREPLKALPAYLREELEL